MNEHAVRTVDVVVLGGGIAGLAAAQSASLAGASVLLLDAAPEVGGVMQTERRDGFLIERGPTSMAGNEQTTHLLSELGLASQIVAPSIAARRRYVVRDGAMHPLPASPSALLRSRLLSARAKLRLLVEPIIATASMTGEESLASLVQRRLGQEVLDYIVDPFVSGVCAGDAERLSKRFTLRALHDLEQEHGSLIVGAVKRAGNRTSRPTSGIISLSGGMQQLAEAFRQKLLCADADSVRENARISRVVCMENSWNVHYSEGEQEGLVTARAVVCALPAYSLSQIAWPDAWSSSLSRMTAVRYAPIATVSLGFRRSQVAHPLDGFGVLFPSKHQHKILGALFNSSMFAGRAPADHCLVTAFVGGTRSHAVSSESDAIQAALLELRPLLGISGVPAVTSVSRWPTGIPQLELGHTDVLMAAQAIERRAPGAFFTGSFLSGVALGDCLAHGCAAGRRAAAAATLRDGSPFTNILANPSGSPL